MVNTRLPALPAGPHEPGTSASVARTGRDHSRPAMALRDSWRKSEVGGELFVVTVTGVARTGQCADAAAGRAAAWGLFPEIVDRNRHPRV